MRRSFNFISLIFLAFLLSPSFTQEKEKITLNVDQAISYAREHSRSIKSAAIDVESSSDNRNHVLNVFCPDVNFSGTISRQNASTDIYTVNGNASLSLNWNLAIIEDIKKANRDYEGGLISWEQTVKQNERDVRKLFYSILLQQESLKNDRQTLENTLQRYENTKKSYESGRAAKLDLLQSNVTYQNMKLDVEKTETAFKQQLRQFTSVLGIPAGREIELEGSLDTEVFEVNKEELLGKYSAYNSEIRLLETQLKGIQAQITGADLKSYTPSFAFNYSTKPTLTPMDQDWFNGDKWNDKGSLSFTLSWDLTNALPFSNNRIKRRDLERQRDQLNLKIQQKKDDIILDTEKLFDQLAASKESIEASKENITLAEESYRLLSTAYNNGSADFIQVKEAESQLNKARLARQSELYTYICAITDLEYMLDLPKDWQIN
ncbi:MAG: TolC family protein [Treponema sp.]|nr:TolC family protein [Treponema sp.]